MPNRLAARDLAVPAPAQGQPGRLVPVGRGGARRARDRGPPAAGLDRLLGLPLVPRDGARVVRGSRDRGADERALRLHQGRPRGAPRRRRGLHGGLPGDDRPGRLAAERVPDARAGAVLRRHLLPARAAPRDAELAHGARGRRRRRGTSAATRSASRAPRSCRSLGGATRLPRLDEPITQELLDEAVAGAARVVRLPQRRLRRARRSSRRRR